MPDYARQYTNTSYDIVSSSEQGLSKSPCHTKAERRNRGTEKGSDLLKVAQQVSGTGRNTTQVFQVLIH